MARFDQDTLGAIATAILIVVIFIYLGITTIKQGKERDVEMAKDASYLGKRFVLDGDTLTIVDWGYKFKTSSGIELNKDFIYNTKMLN